MQWTSLNNILRRRRFIAGAGALAAEALVAGQAASAQPPEVGAPPSRLASVHDISSSSSRVTIQDLLFWNGLVYALFRDDSRNYWGVSVADPYGTIVKRYDLPGCIYLSLAISQGDIVVHALDCRDSSVTKEINVLLGIDPSSGATRTLHSLGRDWRGRLFFVDDSRLLRIATDRFDLWRLSASDLVYEFGHPAAHGEARWYLDVVSPGTAMLTAASGAALTVVDLDSGTPATRPIVAPEVPVAIQRYQARSQVQGSGNPLVLAATGSDQRGSLHALVFGARPGISMPIITLDSQGNGSLARVIQLPSGRPAFRAPIKLWPREGELGIIFADGSMAWY